MPFDNVQVMRRPPALRPAKPAPASPLQNHLLASLPPPVFERLKPDLELIWIPPGKILHESGDHLHHVYFPTSASVSLHYTMENGSSADLAVVGNDGMVGIAFFMGGGTMPHRAMALGGGHLYQLSCAHFRNEFERSGGRRGGALNDLMLRYTQVLLTQMAQTAVCNRHHTVVQQLCRLLLLSIDHTRSLELKMTHAQIADTLGVRREGITEAAGKLQAAGLIRYRRGQIAILDRRGLEAGTCECYDVVRTEYGRLIPGRLAGAPRRLNAA